MKTTKSWQDQYRSYTDKQGMIEKIITQDPPTPPDIIIALPAYRETNILPSLESLINTEKEDLAVELILLINQPKGETNNIVITENLNCLDISNRIKKIADTSQFKIYPVLVQLDPRHAGVGLARKVAMDEAIRRFMIAGKADGIIVQFDADSTCDPNFLVEIKKAFDRDPKPDALSIYFEHPLEGSAEQLRAIISYELHLRYFIAAQRWTGHPHIFHTVGSSIACRADAYVRFGGMNKRKAGEDFYFLNKIAGYGTVNSLHTTRVLPSARVSDRVPFGTGRAMTQILQSGQLFETYPFTIFNILKIFFQYIRKTLLDDSARLTHDFTKLDPHLRNFISEEKWKNKWTEILAHTASIQQCEKRFFQWFNPFMMMKFCNYMRDEILGSKPVTHQAGLLLDAMHIPHPTSTDALDILVLYRNLERTGQL